MQGEMCMHRTCDYMVSEQNLMEKIIEMKVGAY